MILKIHSYPSSRTKSNAWRVLQERVVNSYHKRLPKSDHEPFSNYDHGFFWVQKLGSLRSIIVRFGPLSPTRNFLDFLKFGPSKSDYEPKTRGRG